MGSISVRNAASALKSGTALKMRDAANALRTVGAIKFRDAANVLKDGYSTGGGGTPTISVTPRSRSTSSATLNNNTSTFNADFGGFTPSSIVWSLQSISGGTATIVSGQGTASVDVKLTNTGAAGTTAQCTVKCTAIIGGISVNDTSTKSHTITSTGGGGGGGTVSITNRNLVRTSLHGTTAAQYNLNADGKVYGPGPAQIVETWLTSGAASSFEARATLQSGALASGTTGTWLPLSTSRTWQSVSCQLFIEIRPAGGGATLDSATITLSTDIIETG